MSETGEQGQELPQRAKAVIDALGLEPHPEGGWFRQTWLSPAGLVTDRGERAAASAILFLLPAGDASAWHMVVSDELWLWHGPGQLAIQLGGGDDQPSDEGPIIQLGGDVTAGQQAQVLVPAGSWQRTLPGSADVLVSCVVSPGFEYADWRLADE